MTRLFCALILLTLSKFAMGYDLHITKAANWWESAADPITEEQWETLVRGDEGLTMEANAAAHSPSGDVIQINNPLMASWIEPTTRQKHYFYYFKGQITTKNPSKGAIEKMRVIATRLGGKVQGDEGELY